MADVEAIGLWLCFLETETLLFFVCWFVFIGGLSLLNTLGEQPWSLTEPLIMILIQEGLRRWKLTKAMSNTRISQHDRIQWIPENVKTQKWQRENKFYFRKVIDCCVFLHPKRQIQRVRMKDEMDNDQNVRDGDWAVGVMGKGAMGIVVTTVQANRLDCFQRTELT